MQAPLILNLLLSEATPIFQLAPEVLGGGAVTGDLGGLQIGQLSFEYP